jgi:sec-independent protein translocase protein TatB
MLSIPHMIVVFIIVLVVFGPQKLPELARSLGKLMAEFRKASSDFRGAFEEEMKDLERQAREVERKKTAEAAAKAADAAPVQAATLATVAGTETPPVLAEGQVLAGATTTAAVFGELNADAFGEAIDARVTEGSKELVVTPVAEAVARGSAELDATQGSAVEAASAADTSTAPEQPANGSVTEILDADKLHAKKLNSNGSGLDPATHDVEGGSRTGSVSSLDVPS